MLSETRFDDPTAQALIVASVAEMASRYGGRHGSGQPPQPEELAPPHGTFLLATRDGRAVGCGGLCRYDDTTAEIRRMYTVPDARGSGVARAILAALLERARELGYARVRLETGSGQPEALGLYRSSGFEEIPCWGPYATDERSVCLEQRL